MLKERYFLHIFQLMGLLKKTKQKKKKQLNLKLDKHASLHTFFYRC